MRLDDMSPADVDAELKRKLLSRVRALDTGLKVFAASICLFVVWVVYVLIS